MIDGTKDVVFYELLWHRVIEDAFRVEKLVQRVRTDGGVDIEDLKEPELLDLAYERYSGDWTKVAFAASEMLASYSVPGGIENPEQVVAWVFTAFQLSDAIAHGAADWELNFDNFLNGFQRIREKLEYGEALSIFERAFQYLRK